MIIRDFFGQPYCRPKIRILADYDRKFIALFIRGLHKVQRQTDVNALLLPSGIDPSPIDLDALVPEMPKLVGPEPVKPRTGGCVGDSRIEMRVHQRSPRDQVNQRLCELLHIITWVFIWPTRPPSIFRQVVDVLSINEDDRSHDKKHPPGDWA